MSRSRRTTITLCALAVASLLPTSPVAAQSGTAPAAKAPLVRPAIQNPADARLTLLLVRSTLLALHHANLTGNYTVLRDLGVPAFRDRNSAADLSQIFTTVRLARVDLSAVAVLEPSFQPAPILEGETLRVAGTLATQPLPISFEMVLQPHDGAWRIFALSVNLLPAGSVAGSAPRAP